MEVAWADLKRIPIVVCMEDEGNPHDHGIINECTGFRVNSINEGLVITKATGGINEFKKQVLKNSTIKESASLLESKVFEKKDLLITEIPALNIALTGSIDGGMPPRNPSNSRKI